MQEPRAITASPATAGQLDRIVDYARRKPGTVLALLIGYHLIVWTVLPILVSSNLQLDLVEGLALGKEWQLGYWKHPPLPWWVTDLAYRLTGRIEAAYALGPLAVAVCFYAVWRLARELVGETEALIAVVVLEGIHFYNFSAVKFAHDQMQLPFWALAGFTFWRAVARSHWRDWALAGAFLAGAFWSKYAAAVLALTLGLLLLADPYARRAWHTPGPYLMAAVFALVIAPNAWWLIDHDFMPFRYVDVRAAGATQWHQYVTFPLRWIAGQAIYLAPALAVLALLWLPGKPRLRAIADEEAAFNRRYVTALALGPFIVTTVAATALGRLPVAMWAYPFWSFAPLAALVWLEPATDPRRLRRFAAGAIVFILAVPLLYVAVEIGEPLLRDRSKATQFPGRLLAETVTRQWRERTGTPLAYVGGAELGTAPGEFAANNVAVYSPDRPRVLVHGNPRLSPWIDRGDLRRRGVVLLWQWHRDGMPPNIARDFPDAELQPPILLPRRGPFVRGSETIYYAIVPPPP
jgi:4-amino-4-deoxy-L-arabinose transferase-like glycosyltransferase